MKAYIYIARCVRCRTHVSVIFQDFRICLKALLSYSPPFLFKESQTHRCFNMRWSLWSCSFNFDPRGYYFNYTRGYLHGAFLWPPRQFLCADFTLCTLSLTRRSRVPNVTKWIHISFPRLIFICYASRDEPLSLMIPPVRSMRDLHCLVEISLLPSRSCPSRCRLPSFARLTLL